MQRKKIDAEAEAEAKRRAGATSLPQFKQHMLLKYESMVTAWYALDKTGKGQMGSMDFAEAARLRRRMTNDLNFPPNSEGLVLGCIDADFCK